MLTRKQQWRMSLKQPREISLLSIFRPEITTVTTPDVTRKNVRFSKSAAVVFIPTRYEILRRNCNIWYSCQEIEDFRRDAILEVQIYASLWSIPLDQAKRELFSLREEDIDINSPNYPII